MEVVGSIYTEVSERFQHGIIGGGISRCVKAETHDLGVVMAEIQEKRLGNSIVVDVMCAMFRNLNIEQE